MKTTTEIIAEALDKAMIYKEYREKVEELFSYGKSTSPEHKENLVAYSGLNIHRMHKWDKHFKVSNEVEPILKQIEEREVWLVISEGWCGDAAHILPVINKLAEASENVSLKIVLRDENIELMDQFLTNGARSIPMLIRLRQQDLQVKDTWGSRPREAQELVMTLKSAGKSKEEVSEAVQLWYARNRGKSLEAELAGLIAMD